MSTHPEGTGPAWRSKYDHAIIVLITTLTLAFPQLRRVGLLSGDEDLIIDSTQGTASVQLIYGSCLALACYLAWRYQRQIVRSLVQGGMLVPAFVLLCAASVLWSAYPVITLKRFVQLGTIMLIGIICAMPMLRTEHLRRTLLGTLTVLLGLSALFAVLLPQYGTTVLHNGAWHGILWQKNTLGAAAAFGTLAWIDRLCARQGRGWLGWAGLGLALVALIMSKSSTALLSTIAAAGLYLSIRFAGILQARLTALVLLGTAAAVLVFVQLFYAATGSPPSWEYISSPITSAIGKGSDLTGRTEIWQLLRYSIEQHLFLGTGYGAFWVGEGGPSQYITDALRWMPSHGHNGYLDILNELGIVGLALLALIFLSHAYRLIRLSQFNRAESAFHFSLLALLVISNFSESHLLYSITFQNCLLIYSFFIVANSLSDYQRSAQTPQAAATRFALQ